MKPLNLKEVTSYVNANVVKFHEARLRSLDSLDLRKIIMKKNPYLFKAKNIEIAGDFVKEILEAFLSSSEEKSFGDFLEGLAIFVAKRTSGGHKSSTSGIDLEFDNKSNHYLVSVKSGPNWGNSSQQDKQEQNFTRAINVSKQSPHGKNVEAVLGICYGRTKTSRVRNYLKVVGQSFWYFVSEDRNLYTEIIRPLGHKAKEYNKGFHSEKAKLINVLTREFTDEFCTKGVIDWKKVVELNSSNM